MTAKELPPTSACVQCETACNRVMWHECIDICGREDKPCICRSLTKGINCLEACPKSPESPGCPYFAAEMTKTIRYVDCHSI